MLPLCASLLAHPMKPSCHLVRDEERLARDTPNFRAAQNVRSLQVPQSLKNLSHILGTFTVFQINLMNICYENIFEYHSLVAL